MIQPDIPTCLLYTQAREFRDHIKRERWKSLLDLGCGFCLHAADFATTGRRVVGIDKTVHPEVILFAKEFFVDFRQTTWEAMDRSQQFDVIYAHHLLEHARDPIGAILAWSRMLPMGGILAIGVPVNQHGVVRNGHISMGWSIAHLAATLALAGFDCRNGRFQETAHSVYGYGFKVDKVGLHSRLIEERAKFFPSAVRLERVGTWTCYDKEVNWR